LSATGLDQLGAGSLLIGGTRTQSASATSIDVLANSVVVSNDASNPLTGPEIILVTKTDTSGTDPNATNGLQVDAGSVIVAKGAVPARADQPITIGQTADSANNIAGVSGDGSLLMVSNGALVGITRNDLPTNAQGRLTVGAGAVIDGGQALVL